jgi:hypothetical protein
MGAKRKLRHETGTNEARVLAFDEVVGRRRSNASRSRTRDESQDEFWIVS